MVIYFSVTENPTMDDSETLHRRARLRELVKVRFGGEQKALLVHILSRTGKAANQGELSL